MAPIARPRSRRSKEICSDPHNGGRSVRIVTFADGARVVYKPKDLRLDIVWLKLIEQLNAAGPPIDLKAMRAIARDGFGWTEFIDHASTDATGCKRFFRRAGAWLALFHCFVANDMHQENMIASGDYPVPIDLETILQPALDARDGSDPEAQAFDLAMEKLANSVMMVGLLPAYGRAPDNKVFAIGGMTADWNSKIKIRWDNINSDEMRPARAKETKTPIRTCHMSTIATQNSPITSMILFPGLRITPNFFCDSGMRENSRICTSALRVFRSARSCARPGSIRCCCNA